MNDYLKIFKNGLWNNNQALVAMLGLCPLLAVSNTTINAFGLGVATLLVLMLSNLAISSTRQHIPVEIRIPIFVLIIASLVTIVEVLMQAYFYSLYQILGIFVPLIVTNCAILGRAEAFASKNTVLKSTLDGFSMGLGFMLVLILVGFVRELVGSGTIFAGSELIFNTDLSLQLFDTQTILAILPPGRL
jgi:electron transport complex protein RnfE